MKTHAIRFILFCFVLLLAGCDDGWRAALKADAKQGYAEHLKVCKDPEHRLAATAAIIRIAIQEDEAAWSALDGCKDADAFLDYTKRSGAQPQHIEEAKVEAKRILKGQATYYEAQKEWALASRLWERLLELDYSDTAVVIRMAECGHREKYPVEYTNVVRGMFNADSGRAVSVNISGEVTSLSKKPIGKIVLRAVFYPKDDVTSKSVSNQVVGILDGKPLQPGETRRYRQSLAPAGLSSSCVKMVTIDEIM